MSNEEYENNDETEDDEPPRPRPRRRNHGSDDAQELKDIAEALPQLFGAINESVPKLIQGLIGSIYSPESASNMATAIGQFYSKLKEEGIPEDVALDMTKKFVGALDFSKMMSMISEEASIGRHGKKRVKIDIDDEDEDDWE
jgi:hypothetical protein